MNTTPASVRSSMTDDRYDSGYSSTQFPSPNDKPNNRSVPSVSTPIAGFAEFDKSVDNATLSRFRHVHSLLEKPLLEYIRSTIRKKQCPISLRLMVLGRSEDDAKPCIVVLCPEQQSKKVRKFFNKKSVRALCLPEDSQASFEVFVVGREPQMKQATGDIDVLVPIVGESEGYTNETYCGAPIVIRQTSSVDKRCTLGGVIKASWPNGEIKLYGLTVGHILLDELEDNLTASTDGNQSSCSEDWVFQLSDSDTGDESCDSAEEDQDDETELLCMMGELQLALPDASSSWAADELSKIGSISKDSLRYQSAATSTKHDEPEAYYDWALIDMLSYKPNLIRPRKMSHDEAQEGGVFNFRDQELVKPVSPSSNHGKRHPVVLISGSEGLKRGSLSVLPSRLLLGPGREFVDALILNLDGNKQILDGDSGSWVVNETTFEVYGYVVATDAFGGGYVIPLAEAFHNITDVLRCQSVDLATTIDMASAKLGRMFDKNGEPTTTMAPIITEHSVLPSPPIISYTSTKAANLSILDQLVSELNGSLGSTPATNLPITSKYDDAPAHTISPSLLDNIAFPIFAQEKPFTQPRILSDCYGGNSGLDNGVMIKRHRAKIKPILEKQIIRPMSTEHKADHIQCIKVSEVTRYKTLLELLKAPEDTKHPRSPPVSPSSSQKTSPLARKDFPAENDGEEILEVCMSGTPTEKSQTSSNMPTSYEEGASNNVFDRIIDTINAARDFAHVIWNVGRGK